MSKAADFMVAREQSRGAALRARGKEPSVGPVTPRDPARHAQKSSVLTAEAGYAES